VQALNSSCRSSDVKWIWLQAIKNRNFWTVESGITHARPFRLYALATYQLHYVINDFTFAETDTQRLQSCNGVQFERIPMIYCMQAVTFHCTERRFLYLYRVRQKNSMEKNHYLRYCSKFFFTKFTRFTEQYSCHMCSKFVTIFGLI